MPDNVTTNNQLDYGELMSFAEVGPITPDD
jgi:hypothetical protein